MFVAMPLGQAVAAVILVYLSIRSHHGKVDTTIVGCASVITSIMVWLFGFPMLSGLLMLAPAALGFAVVLFGLYGFLTSILGGFLCGRLFRRMVSQHAQSFGAPPE